MKTDIPKPSKEVCLHKRQGKECLHCRILKGEILSLEELTMFMNCQVKTHRGIGRMYYMRDTLYPREPKLEPATVKVIYSGRVRDHETLPFQEVKLILRPLSDMTDEEKIQCASILGVVSMSDNRPLIEAINELFSDLRKSRCNIRPEDWFHLTRFLISKHFDLFGYIDKGLAIRKEKQDDVQ
jgi:hypothetical protein